MITVTTTTGAEARAIIAWLQQTPEVEYRVCLAGAEVASGLNDGRSRIEVFDPEIAEFPVDPRRRAMRDILRAAGPAGLTTASLFRSVQELGYMTARDTGYRWLLEDERQGLVCRSRAPQVRRKTGAGIVQSGTVWYWIPQPGEGTVPTEGKTG